MCYGRKYGAPAFGYLKKMTLSAGRKVAFDNRRPPVAVTGHLVTGENDSLQLDAMLVASLKSELENNL